MYPPENFNTNATIFEVFSGCNIRSVVHMGLQILLFDRRVHIGRSLRDYKGFPKRTKPDIVYVMEGAKAEPFDVSQDSRKL